MKKVFLLFLIAAVMFSCKKNETTQPAADQYAEVSFNVTTLVPDAGRDWVYDYDVPQCDPDAIPGWALMIITDSDGVELEGDGEEGPNGNKYFKVQVFYTNGELYTQSIKLPVAMCDTAPNCCETYFVTEFYMYDENGNMIKAAPYPGTGNDDESEFFQFVTQPLPVELTICAFEKKEFYIDVLCFTPDYYELFGFFWFEITEITVREVCFYGDVCQAWWLDNFDVPLTYWEETTNLYQDQVMGIQQDMPAIFALKLLKLVDDQYIIINSWTNDTWLTPGEGAPLCFRYADYDAEEDTFMIEMFIYGPWDGFGYTQIAQHTWEFTDNALEDLDLNGDGVIEFAWGDCVEDPEYQLPESVPGK